MKDIIYTEEIVEEIYRCSQDICYFAKVIGCELSYEGEFLLKSMSDNQKINLINHNREFIVPYILYYMVFHDCQRIGIVTKKYKELMQEIQDTYEKLPTWMKRGIFQCNKTVFQIDNNTQLKVMNLSICYSRLKGWSLNFLIIDDIETYRRGDWENFFTMAYPTCSMKHTKLLFAAHAPNEISENFKQEIFTIENIM